MRFWLTPGLCLLLIGCGGPLSLLTGGGPNVAANVQAGAENEQSVTLGQDQEIRQTITRPQARTIEQSSGKTSARAEKIDTLTINEASEGIPAPWDWTLLVMALALSLARLPGWLWRFRSGVAAER